jgi:hypothetical protein
MKFILYILGFLNTSIALGQQHQNGNIYLLYDIPSNKHYNIDQEIIPKTIAPGTFWALTFGFNEIIEGGYIGIQTDYRNVKFDLNIRNL